MDGFQRLTLASLYHDDEQITDRIDSLLVRAVADVRAEGIEGDATITINLKVARLDKGSVTVTPTISYKEPKREFMGTVALIDPSGATMVQSAHQAALPLFDIEIKRTKKEKSNVDG